MQIFSKLWFWFVLLILFLTVIMYDFDWEKEWKVTYQRTKMLMSDVHFSEIDQTFEHVRVFADTVDMDDSQTNMVASKVRALFFDKLVATRSGELLASAATKNPHEIKFWGDVRIHTTDNERMRSDELRYYVDRKDLYVPATVTLWKDNMIITGQEMRMNTQTKDGTISRDVKIRIWKSASATRSLASPSPTLPPGPNTVAPEAVATGTESEDIPPSWGPLPILGSHSVVASDTMEPRDDTE